MRSLQKKEDLAALAQEYLVGWKHLPYRSFFSTDFAAADSYLAQFKQIERSAYKPDGTLYLYTDKDMFFGIRHLISESKNFGMHCARLEPAAFKSLNQWGNSEVLKAAEFLRSVIDNPAGPLHLSAIAACDDIFCQQVLQVCGFRLADTIAGYHAKLSELPDLEIDKAVRIARPEDVPRLAEITAMCFSQHQFNINRFNSDPAFARETAGATYADWFTRATLEKEADIVLVFDDGELSGFMTWRLPPSHEKKFGMSLGRAILSAVDPSRHGQGIYQRLLLSGAHWMRQKGVKLIEGKMHLSNHKSLNGWRQLKPRLVLTYHTFHWSSSSVGGLSSMGAMLDHKYSTVTI